MKMKHNTKGFTILELTIVAVVIAVISALAIPQFAKVMERLKLKTAGRDVISSLRLARSSAVSQRDQFGVYFDYTENQYVLFHDLANPSSFTYNPGSDTIIVTKALPGRVNIGYVSFPSSAVIFRPNGSAASSGQVLLYSYSEGEQYLGSLTVDVLGSTGRVKLLLDDYYFGED
jgi:prepilin-type N-terminal cleavage/methylation domain-containing protein